MILRNCIKEIIRKHLNDGYIAMGQCLTAVGWVGGTLPELYEQDGMIECSWQMLQEGVSLLVQPLAGKRPIYIIRYQGFCWFNLPIILNYACKSKEIWGIPCPMLIRSWKGRLVRLSEVVITLWLLECQGSILCRQ